MSNPRSTLTARHADLTQGLILDAAVALLESGSVADLSVRAVARHAGISERTVFRYFATREDLLDAIAAEVSRRLGAPAEPSSAEELPAYAEALYRRFEDAAALTQAALHSELYDRIRTSDARPRAAAIRAILDDVASARSAREREIAAANIQHHLVASTWRYYRFYFAFSLEDAIACARVAIRDTLAGVGVAIAS